MPERTLETIARELHADLPDKLREASGKPVYITVTYKDGDTLRHWSCTNNEYPPGDILPSLDKLAQMAGKDHIPKNHAKVVQFSNQLKARRRPGLNRRR